MTDVLEVGRLKLASGYVNLIVYIYICQFGCYRKKRGQEDGWKGNEGNKDREGNKGIRIETGMRGMRERERGGNLFFY